MDQVLRLYFEHEAESFLQAGFLKSSPKVILHPRAAKQFGLAHRSLQNNSLATDFASKSRKGNPGPPSIPNNATWICPICSFSNLIPINFDPTSANDGTPLPPCLTCGINPPLVLVVKAALASISNRSGEPCKDSFVQPDGSQDDQLPRTIAADAVDHMCQRCTFKNHPSMTSCEICGASLEQGNLTSQGVNRAPGLPRTESPGPSLANSTLNADPSESLKFSFRAGGERIFLERVKGALIQRKWLLQLAPTTSRHETSIASGTVAPALSRNIGITGLERRDREMRKNNEVVIGNAFEDLSALMASAKEIIALAEKFASQTKFSGVGPTSPVASNNNGDVQDPTMLLSSLNLTTTKDMLGASSGAGSNSTYLTQLARQLADFLTDDTSGTAILKSAGGIISLVDLWAVFNRARGGVELVSPTDFADAVTLFEQLKMPVRMRTFESGLRVVRSAEWSDERIIKALMTWLRDLRLSFGTDVKRGNSSMVWGRGVTALDVADRFGWSVGVANEELAMVEERGLVCREVGLEGVKFWENSFLHDVESA